MNKRILIVDDSPANIKILGNALREDYEIAIATNGERCLSIAESENPPELILLDVVMPGMDGYEVCKRLKKNKKTQNIPVIFITGKGDVEDETKGLELGAVDYIIKPFSVPIVKARIKTQLNLKHKSDILEKLTCLDGLTNISNRRKFDEFLMQEWNQAMRSQRVLSLLMMDVDFFKNFNDNYGHAAGDECLVKVAQAIEHTLVRSTDFVARYGGEEFVVVLPETDIKPAEVFAEKVRLNVENLNIPHLYSQASEKVTLSIGVATTIPHNCFTSLDLMNAADAALYQAKESGRNRIESTFLK